VLKELIKLANELDAKGLHKEADALDMIIKIGGVEKEIRNHLNKNVNLWWKPKPGYRSDADCGKPPSFTFENSSRGCDGAQGIIINFGDAWHTTHRDIWGTCFSRRAISEALKGIGYTAVNEQADGSGYWMRLCPIS